MCAPSALTQLLDITEVPLALLGIAAMQTGIILFSLGIFILDSSSQNSVESNDDLKPNPYTSDSQTSGRHQQRLENFETDFVFERKPVQKSQKSWQAVCRGLSILSWTRAFPPEGRAWRLHLIVPRCEARGPWKAMTNCHSLSQIQWRAVVSGVAVCPTEGDNQYQIREWGHKREINIFVSRVIQGFGRASKYILRNAFLKF